MTKKHAFVLALTWVLTACSHQTAKETKADDPKEQNGISGQAANLDKAKNALDEANAKNANRLAQIDNQ